MEDKPKHDRKSNENVYLLPQLSLYGNVYGNFLLQSRLCTVAENLITLLGSLSTRIPSSGRSIWTPPSSSWIWSLVKSLCWGVSVRLSSGSEYMMHKASWVRLPNDTLVIFLFDNHILLNSVYWALHGWAKFKNLRIGSLLIRALELQLSRVPRDKKISEMHC